MVKKKATTKNKEAETTGVAVDPFAEMVDTPASKKRAIKSESGAGATGAIKEKATTRVATKAAAPVIEISADAFAETVTGTSPVKKNSVPRAAAIGELSEPGAVATGEVKKTSKKTSKKAEVELSPFFKALADVTLPELEKENRARLLMQSPTRLYFYWSVRENPWQRLRSVFGDDLGSYTLVLKLTDLKHDTEEIHPCEAEGNWWFAVEPDGEYMAEIGFYAVNRPYFRVIYSNTVMTPRRSPSPRAATDADWTVSANKFAEVLDVAGFSRDAFDVAMAGDDYAGAENVTHSAFSRFIGKGEYKLEAVSAEDIRYAMLALASGATLEELRFRVSPALFAILQANAEKLAADKALSALSEYFDIDEAEWTEEEFGPAVYGASLVHFPKTLKTKRVESKFAPRYNPVSSHSFR